MGHIFWCLGALVIGGKKGKCRHGKPLKSWQTQISTESAQKLLTGILVLIIFVAATLVVVLPKVQ